MLASSNLKDHVELVFRLVYLIQLADMLMRQLFQSRDLRTHTGQVFTEGLLVHDLDSHAVASQAVITQLHLRKATYRHTGVHTAGHIHKSVTSGPPPCPLGRQSSCDSLASPSQTILNTTYN